MKKGLLTLLAASLVFVGCQNYDDQFDDLNAQISALKSQVDGLSSLSGQVSALSGTISGLQSGIAAAASSSELTALSSSLASLQADVDAVQASLATAASASAVAALQAEINAINTDLDDLLATSNIYSSDVTVTNATTLNSALALGNKINVLNATLTITGYSGMDYAGVQTLVDRVNTTTGNIVYSAASSTGTQIVFNNLVSAGDIDMTQGGGYSFPKLANAGTINLQNDYATTVTNISFPALTTVTDMQTEGASTDKFTVTFAYATNVDFGALVTTPGSTVEITTKKDATLDLGNWVAKDASGNYISTTLTLNGPASFTNGTAAGTFASTGLPGQTVGAHEGTINLTNVATAAVHNFRGTLNVNGGVKNFTGNNIVSLNTAGTGLETVDITFIRNNTTDLDATALAALDKSSSSAQDLSFDSTHTKLTSIKVRGKGGDLVVNAAPALTSIDLATADMFDLTIHNNPALTSYTSAAKAEDIIFDNNDVLTAASLSHTTKLTVTGDTSVSVSVDGNAELTSLTLGMDDVSSLSVQSNAKLASINATALKDNGSATTTSVDVDNNALVADLVRDTMESDATRAATGWAVGGSTDTGSITTGSGMKTLDAYIVDAIAATGTVSVWFDTVTKLEVQATQGGSYTDQTSNLGTVAYTKAQAQVFTGSARTGYYAYAYASEASGGVTTGAITHQMITNVFDVNREGSAQTDKALGSGEGIKVALGGATYEFKQGDVYSGSTVATVDALVSYLDNANYSGVGDVIAARDGYEKTLVTVSYVNSTSGNATVGIVSTTGNIVVGMGADQETGVAKYLTAAVTAGDSQADVATAISLAIGRDADFTTASATDNQFYITRNVSANATMDLSPLAVDVSVTPVIDAAQTSTTAGLTPSGYDAVMAGTSSNVEGQNSSFFSLTISETKKYGIRVTLKNTGSLAFASTVGTYANKDSNTAIVTGTAAQGVLTNGLLVAGVNITTWVADTMESPENYVAGFGDITSGSTTATVTAVTINRTGW